MQHLAVYPKLPELIHQRNNLDTYSDATDLLTLTLSHVNTHTRTPTHMHLAKQTVRCTERLTISESEFVDDQKIKQIQC